jgi:hypothetical protein
MKAKDKLRATWSKKDDTVSYHFPLGSQTKSDAGFLSGFITEDMARVLEARGYDITTLKFSIEPKKGDQRFASQRDNNEET